MGLYLEKLVGKFVIRSSVCFIKIRSKLSSVLLLCLLRIFMKHTLVMFLEILKHLPFKGSGGTTITPQL